MELLIFLIVNLFISVGGITLYKETVVPCMFDSDCRTIWESAKCIQKTCKCHENCSYRDTSVVTKIGLHCISLQDCNVEGSYCLHNVCTCKKDMIVSSNGKKCLNESEGIGSECMEDNQCSVNVTSSICVNNVCSCGPNMHFYDNTCISNKSLGEQCTIPEECSTDYSTCDGHCKCIKRYVRTGDRCLLMSKTLLSPCTENIQCEQTLGFGSQCNHDLCNCHELYHFKATVNKCIRDLLLGEVCTEHEDCHQPGSGIRRLECILGECKCKPPYMQVNDYCISSSPKLSKKMTAYLCLLVIIYNVRTIYNILR